ncbi:hypothetical protein CCR97_27325 [Rhodoplanes elegans]|uniref:Uncharacterized protein n=1 Tax=Rhodoplanes elegans TaxID=29408 RepID=A0A327KWI2_9BRAD|nr:hypothetical protein [Rhodoplanes elegans]MBK5961891.1 hypothetical protein [Rhodoplanes elegans]RAI41582.1 hypothetical protein CH338_02705 [Rhodoplanes elegans]
MRIAALCLGAALAVGAIMPAAADVLITSDTGGMIGDYVSRWQRVRQSGERVVIDGTCLSACTIVVGMIPRDRLCATRNAALGFHAAWLPDQTGRRVTSPVATRALWGLYPGSVRRWIAQRGGLTPNMLMMRGRDLAGVVQPCDGAVRRVASAPRRAAAPQARSYRRATRAIATPAVAEAAMAR